MLEQKLEDRDIKPTAMRLLVHRKLAESGVKNIKEVIGQIPRLLFGGVKSFVGHIPIGNTGEANISPLKKLPISEDLLVIFKKSGLEKYGT